MPGTKATVALVATGAIGIGVMAYKINKFKQDYAKAGKNPAAGLKIGGKVFWQA